MVYGGEIVYLMVLYQSKNQQEGHRMNGADFGTSELIYSENIIINGFHFPYPLNGSNNIQNRYRI